MCQLIDVENVWLKCGSPATPDYMLYDRKSNVCQAVSLCERCCFSYTSTPKKG